MGDNAFYCDLYIERREPTREWLSALCHDLWRRGARLESQHLATTWDEQLSQPYTLGYSSMSLSTLMSKIIERGYGTLDFLDRDVDFTLSIDPLFKEMVGDLEYVADVDALKSLPFGLIHLYLHSPLAGDVSLPPGLHTSTAYLIRPKYQVYLAMAHWTAVISASVHPVFGVGFHQRDQASDNGYFEKGHQRIVQALARGDLPSFDGWLTHTPILYAGPRFVSMDLLHSWASAEERYVRLLPHGALLAYEYPNPYDIAVAEEFIMRGDDRSLAPSDRLACFLRAREIFEIYRGRRERFGNTVDNFLSGRIADVERSMREDDPHE